MKRFLLASLASGGLFGVGLAMSGMTDARKVIGFLDVAGDFDPGLLYVLGGAMITSAVLFALVMRRQRPAFAQAFQLSGLRAIDRPLLGGAALFGIGWGIAGYCPGPALAGLGVGSVEALWFVSAMLAGSALHWAFTAAKQAKVDR